MKFSWNMLTQILATAAQAGTVLTNYVPPQYHPVVVLSIGVIQAVSALVAHFSNPDGTPANQPYIKPLK